MSKFIKLRTTPNRGGTFVWVNMSKVLTIKPIQWGGPDRIGSELVLEHHDVIAVVEKPADILELLKDCTT